MRKMQTISADSHTGSKPLVLYIKNLAPTSSTHNGCCSATQTSLLKGQADAAEGSATPREPMHGLRLIIKEDALPLREQPKFEALTEVARRGLLAAETWQSNRPHISLKTTIDVPLLGTAIEQNGDGLLEDSLTPVGWPLHLDGAVKQRCVHRTTTLQELDDLLSAYDMKRDLVEINYKAAQWSHRAVWNQWYMEPKRDYNLGQLWADHTTDILVIQKVTSSREVTLDDIQRVAAVAASKPTAQLPESVFLRVLETSEAIRAPPQTGSHSQRATEEYERNICENKAFAILNSQAGKTEIIKKDGGEMLVAIALDKPLADVKELVEDHTRLIAEIMQILQDKQAHPVLAQMVNPDVRDDLPISEFATASSASGSSRTRKRTQPNEPHDRFQ